MGLIQENTKWVLFLSSSEEDPEHRHILDIAYGIFSLENSGVHQSDIHIYIDGHDRETILELISTATSYNYNIKVTDDFFTDNQYNNYENMVIFVTGHGSINGIDHNPPITPYQLLNTIKSTPNLLKSIVYLGQCYAGVFNYIGAGRAHGKESQRSADVIFIGATNLHESLSTSTTESCLNGDVSWVANLFLLHVFKWISSPIDVDGDNKKTIIDSYKYAGVSSNAMNKGIKIRSFVNSMKLHSQWTIAQNTHASSPTTQNELSLKAITEQYVGELTINYTHQECWILNAIPAQFIEI
ncbi:hypothetical protein JTF12_13940 [Leclercia adecarboxylata]|jgi:hypothetical protein|uniref:hypothetical protein n=1 Tax=Leclercia adecarboxylata TaxID=83655 RepID=UPI00194DFDDB|nr:hypothetical protein [Leclercia adecarboxylata]MBM6635430.1 hypothetical protein [Leclercia adecarboxylata]